MGRYLLVRLMQALPVILLASVAVWLLIYLIPGDPAVALLGLDASATQVENARREMGLDRPLPIQYALWLGRMVQGDLGVSYLTGLPVADLLPRRIGVSLHLAVATMLLAPTVAIPLGIATAIRPRARSSRAVSVLVATAMAVPNFWLGILLVLFVGLQLKWLPTSGYVPFWEDPAQSLRHLVLPAVTLSLYIVAIMTRFTQAAVTDVLHEDYVRTARAKGLRERAVIRMHIFRNALIPVVTIVGLQFGNIMGGAVIVESIFDYPGLGRMLISSIFQRDYAVIQATILFVVCVFVIINLLTDIAYAYIDPRIRYT